MDSEKYIPWGRPDFHGSEKEFVNNALDSTWISGGYYVDKIEKEISEYSGSEYALSVSNGTTAIHVAYIALGLKPGDEIIMPGFGFLAAANVALQLGIKPVFADVDPNTWCITSQGIEECITINTKAIVPIHTYGNVCNMDEIVDLANQNNIPVIEDAAEAFGSKYDGEYAGGIGHLGIYSFQATKTITTGEGGMVITDDKDLYDRMVLFRNHGMLRKTHYWHDVAGHNFRLTNLQAAVGCAQFNNIDKIIVERNRVQKIYGDCLKDHDGITFQQFNPKVDELLWAFAIKLNPMIFSQGRDVLIKQMEENNIETRPGFYPPSLMKHIYESRTLSICEDIGQNIISLPTFTSLKDKQIQYICKILLKLRDVK